MTATSKTWRCPACGRHDSSAADVIACVCSPCNTWMHQLIASPHPFVIVVQACLPAPAAQDRPAGKAVP